MKNSADESLRQALKSATAGRSSGKGGLKRAVTLMVDYLTSQSNSVAKEQERIRQKIDNGARLTNHRFTV